MFLFLHGLALALSMLFGFGGGSGFTHVGGMAAPMDAGAMAPTFSPGDSGGGMPPGAGSPGGTGQGQ